VVFNGGFLITGHLDQIDDFSGELQLVSKMKGISLDIIGRVMSDSVKCESHACANYMPKRD
jgi:hypothetical protein